MHHTCILFFRQPLAHIDMDYTEAKRIGRTIRQLRKRKGWLQRDLAERIGGGCDQTVVSRWETGKLQPSRETLTKITDLFETSLELFYPVDQPQEPGGRPQIIDPVLGQNLVSGSAFAGFGVQVWILNQIESAYIRASVEPDAFPEWLKRSRVELGS